LCNAQLCLPGLNGLSGRQLADLVAAHFAQGL
jgi:hypothetical protein